MCSTVPFVSTVALDRPAPSRLANNPHKMAVPSEPGLDERAVPFYKEGRSNVYHNQGLSVFGKALRQYREGRPLHLRVGERVVTRAVITDSSIGYSLGASKP